jgi:CBS domain-containing protein
MTMARKVKELMHRGAETVRPDDTVKHAAIKMEACEIGPLPVCDGDRLVGMITDRDITVRAVAAGRDPNTTKVRETMTAERVVFVQEEQDVDQAVELMRKHELRRLPVLDESKRLVGMVALADLAREGSTRQQSKALEGVSKPTETQGTAR